MTLFHISALAMAAALALAMPAQAAQPTQAVDVRYGEWSDPARDGRIVPYKLYLPTGAGPFPLIVHSHGLGGSREASTYILQAVAEAGFAVATLQHAGSDSGLLAESGGGRRAEAPVGGAARNAGMSAQAAQARYGDVPFALDRLAEASRAGGPLAGKLDLARIGMSGHSYGALSTLVAVGQRTLGAAPGVTFAEPRVKAAIAYSPNKPRGDADPVAAFARVRTPMLHFTGTADTTPFDLETSPFERTTPYQAMSGADQYLIILKDADHALFGGRRVVTRQLKPIDPPQMEIVKAETVRFWRAHLGGDAEALRDLCALPARMKAAGEGFVKAARCGPPTPIAPVDGLR